jgi:hypothetical protein
MKPKIIEINSYKKEKDLKFCWDALSVVSVACDKHDMSHITDKYLTYPEFTNGYIDDEFFDKTLKLMVYLSIKGAHSENHIGEELAIAMFHMLDSLQKYSASKIDITSVGCELSVALGNNTLEYILKTLNQALDSSKDDEIQFIVGRYLRFISKNEPHQFNLKKFALLIKTIDCLEQCPADLFQCQCAKKHLQQIECLGVEYLKIKKPTQLEQRILELI